MFSVSCTWNIMTLPVHSHPRFAEFFSPGDDIFSMVYFWQWERSLWCAYLLQYIITETFTLRTCIASNCTLLKRSTMLAINQVVFVIMLSVNKTVLVDRPPYCFKYIRCLLTHFLQGFFGTKVDFTNQYLYLFCRLLSRTTLNIKSF